MDNIIKNMNCFVDGRGYAGHVTELTPPKLTIKTDEHQAGGMDTPIQIDMGMEKIEATFILTKYDPEVLKLFGVVDSNTTRFTFRAAAQSEDNKVTPIILEMSGKLKEIDRGTWKPAEKATTTFNIALDYYKETIDGQVIIEIDVKNMKRIINGTDRLADMRSALGM